MVQRAVRVRYTAPMKLADYMNAHSITPRQLRWMLGVKSRTTVVRYINGERLPAPDLMERIHELTGGAVTLADFMDPAPARCARLVLDRHGRRQLVYPWTNIEHHRLPRRVNDNNPPSRDPVPLAAAGNHRGAVPPVRPPKLGAGDDADGWPSPPLKRALEVLGRRVKLAKRGGFLLDGRLVDARRVVAEANRVLLSRGEPPIPYPGVEPLHD